MYLSTASGIPFTSVSAEHPVNAPVSSVTFSPSERDVSAVQLLNAPEITETPESPLTDPSAEHPENVPFSDVTLSGSVTDVSLEQPENVPSRAVIPECISTSEREIQPENASAALTAAAGMMPFSASRSS